MSILSTESYDLHAAPSLGSHLLFAQNAGTVAQIAGNSPTAGRAVRTTIRRDRWGQLKLPGLRGEGLDMNNPLESRPPLDSVDSAAVDLLEVLTAFTASHNTFAGLIGRPRRVDMSGDGFFRWIRRPARSLVSQAVPAGARRLVSRRTATYRQER